MHQLIYISSDEEITSLVDRLRKSKVSENFFVVPKRAMVLQSIVNLKILKKEAEKLKKQIVFVTQDEAGETLARKVGIMVRSNLDGLETTREKDDDLTLLSAGKQLTGGKEISVSRVGKRERLENIGSQEFFDEEEDKAGKSARKTIGAVRLPKPGTPVALRVEEQKKIFTGGSAEQNQGQERISRELAPAPRRSPAINDVLVSSGRKRIEENVPLSKGFQFERKLSPQKEKKLESLFQADKKTVEPETPVAGPVSKKAKKLIIIFIFACLLVGSGVAAYLFVPRSKVIIYPRYKIQEMDLEITGDAARSEADMQSQTIPIKVAEKEKELTVSYQTTGKSASSLQKARGKVVIYNEYSNSSQPLVATTRLLSSDGKLFRLVKGVTVPGMTSLKDKTQPGAIEAEVVADESGESYNIGPSEFSIPGFEGSPKHEKFYARSAKPMTGGGSGGTATPIVSQQDIDEAKRKAETAIKAQLEEELEKDFPAGYVLLPGALEQEIKEATPAAKVGDLKDSFDYYIKVTARAIAFSEDDTKKIITGVFRQKSEENESVAPIAVQVEYGNISPDFSARIAKIKVHGKILLNPELDLEQLKKDLLGKNEGEIKEVLGNYPQIERIEVDFWPKFFPSRIPSYEKQTTVELRTLNL